MRNTPLKAFAKKGKSPLPQEFKAPDLSHLKNQYVSDTDTSHDVRSIPPIVDERTKLEKLAENESKNRGSITKTREDKAFEEMKKKNSIATLFGGR